MLKFYRGFTLIELLVVITIIVVLLSLLTPALDKALYQADLAVCGARLKAIGSAASVYALDNQRAYPNRDPEGSPHLLSSEGYDMRDILRDYMSINKMLQCALTPQVDLDDPNNWALRPSAKVYASYYLWFGWQYVNQAGLKRLGQRFGWHDTSNATGDVRYRFSMLASDHDVISEPSQYAHGSHPDPGGTMSSFMQQRADDMTTVTVLGGSTFAKWELGGNAARPPLDLNFTYADGSTRRVDAVQWKLDPRMARVSHGAQGTSVETDWANVPKE